MKKRSIVYFLCATYLFMIILNFFSNDNNYSFLNYSGSIYFSDNYDHKLLFIILLTVYLNNRRNTQAVQLQSARVIIQNLHKKKAVKN